MTIETTSSRSNISESSNNPFMPLSRKNPKVFYMAMESYLGRLLNERSYSINGTQVEVNLHTPENPENFSLTFRPDTPDIHADPTKLSFKATKDSLCLVEVNYCRSATAITQGETEIPLTPMAIYQIPLNQIKEIITSSPDGFDLSIEFFKNEEGNDFLTAQKRTQ